MNQYNKPQLNNLLLGASLLATGGGCALEKKKDFLKNISYPVTIMDARDFAADDLLCAVYAVGPTSIQETNFEDGLRLGISEVEKYARDKLSGLFIGELGAEHLAIGAAQMSGIDILDADGTGGRAVPEIVQDQFPLNGRHTTPAIVVDQNQAARIFEDLSPQDLENTVREIATRTKGLVLVFDHIMRGAEIGLLSCGNLKQSIQIGELLTEKRFDKLGKLGIDLIAEAKIINIKSDSQSDFFRATINLKRRDDYQILIQNENLVLLKNNSPIVTCPNLIMLIDRDGKPVHNSNLDSYIGTTVTIVTKKATNAWQSKRGRELFSPRRFGFDYDVVYKNS